MPSCGSSVTLTSVLFHAPTADAFVVGAVLSILTFGLVALTALPARSETEAVAARFSPSPAIVLRSGQPPSTPESASALAHAISTLLVYQPLSPAVPAATDPLSDGAVVSMFTGPMVVAASLSALSTAAALTSWSAPSESSTFVPPPVQLLMPESASAQLRPTVTFVLFQPWAFAAGLRVAVISGSPLSSLTVTAPEALLPSRSAAVAVRVTPPTGVFEMIESVAGVGPEPTPEPASVAVHAIDTFALFQPAALAAGERAPVTTGPVLSMT